MTNALQGSLSAKRVVFEANDRCNQENIIEQMKNGVHAMEMPSNGLNSNWVWMLIIGLFGGLGLFLFGMHTYPFCLDPTWVPRLPLSCQA